MDTEYKVMHARLEALESKYETMRLAALEWGKDVDKLMRWSDQHLKRIEKLEAGATCPHIVSSDEGTSYCALAEQTAKPTSNSGLTSGSLVEQVARAISLDSSDANPAGWTAEARAAIRTVEQWLREQPWPNAANALQKEIER